MCMIDWSRNGGEEEEEGIGILCSRLGMPACAQQDEFYSVCSIDWSFSN